MKYKQIISGKFIDRPNRFIAHVEIDGVSNVVHVCNTGRCKELLVPDATVYLSVADNPARSTKYDLIGVEKETTNGKIMINMDSYAPNRAVGEWLSAGGLGDDVTDIKPECKYGNSRFDFYFKKNGRHCFLEVKGVTLENDGVVSFPDAPTQRGVKHIEELMDAINEGYDTYICFVVQMNGMKHFAPNDDTHRAFGDALRAAHKAGVNILAVQCDVSPDEMTINNQFLEIRLNH